MQCTLCRGTVYSWRRPQYGGKVSMASNGRSTVGGLVLLLRGSCQTQERGWCFTKRLTLRVRGPTPSASLIGTTAFLCQSSAGLPEAFGSAARCTPAPPLGASRCSHAYYYLSCSQKRRTASKYVKRSRFSLLAWRHCKRRAANPSACRCKPECMPLPCTKW